MMSKSMNNTLEFVYSGKKQKVFFSMYSKPSEIEQIVRSYFAISSDIKIFYKNSEDILVVLSPNLPTNMTLYISTILPASSPPDAPFFPNKASHSNGIRNDKSYIGDTDLKAERKYYDKYSEWKRYASFPVKAHPFYIFVKTLTGRTINIDCKSTDLVIDIKKEIEKREGVPVNKQNLIFAGKQLEEGKTLADCNISLESTLHMILRLKGC